MRPALCPRHFAPQLSAKRVRAEIEGLTEVKRVVCGGCLDFKACACDHSRTCGVRLSRAPATPRGSRARARRAAVQVIIALDVGAFGEWEKYQFCPEGDFIAKLAAIDGISGVETQTYTFMTV